MEASERRGLIRRLSQNPFARGTALPGIESVEGTQVAGLGGRSARPSRRATRAALVSHAASSHAASRGASRAASRPHTRAASRPITGKNVENVESGEEKVPELQQSPVASNLSLKDQVKEQQQQQKQKERGERLRVRLENPSPGPFRNAALTPDSSRFYHY